MMGYWGNMMGWGYGAGSGPYIFAALFCWLLLVVWTINSILIMLVLIKYYERLNNERTGRKK